MKQTKKWPMLSLTVMEWEEEATKAAFMNFMSKYYPDNDAAEVIGKINKMRLI
jgi:hypothetical protein